MRFVLLWHRRLFQTVLHRLPSVYLVTSGNLCQVVGGSKLNALKDSCVWEQIICCRVELFCQKRGGHLTLARQMKGD